MIIFLSGFYIFIKNKIDQNWQVKSIDTMKYSRDEAQRGINDKNYVSSIDRQMAEIAGAGANYVAIGTPYDKEFLPVLRLWVKAARRRELKVFFRGNFSGWEEWFGYEKIGEEEHLRLTEEFILENSDLFEDGDIFSSCPECENGPRFSYHDKIAVSKHRSFILQEYQLTKKAFEEIEKDVDSNYFSMNMDVAKLIMDRETTEKLDGIVTVDHYVKDTEVLARDVEALANQTGGMIVLGEFGAPIPDIHGEMNNQQQKDWIEAVLTDLSNRSYIKGVNYWVGVGGSTALWSDSGDPKPAVEVIRQFYQKK